MMKNYKLYEASLISKFEVGKSYRYDELPKSIQNEIDVQFDDGYEPEDDPQNYVWIFKYLKPEDTIEFIESVFGEYNLDDALEHPYMKRLIKNIKEHGINKPAVGVEGSHRALACWHLGIDLPYLEPHYEPIDDDDTNISEAAMIRQDKADNTLLSLQGDEFEKSPTKTIIDVMRGKITEERKQEIVDYINKMTGKKIVFYNIKGGRNIRKERILDPDGYAYWKGVRLFFKGQVKDYEVNITKDFGYYGRPVKKPVIICALDPYNEEDWDI